MTTANTYQLSAGLKWQDILIAGNWQEPASIVFDEDGVLDLESSYAQGTGAPFGQGFIVDMSALMSKITGRQQSMCANYRVKSLGISMRNVNDGNDNNRAHFYQGEISWYGPNRHLIDTIQAFRGIRSELAQLAISDDGSPKSVFEKYLPSSGFSELKDYRGFRFGLNRGTDIHFPDDELIDMLSISPNSNQEQNQMTQATYNGVSIESMLRVVDAVKYDVLLPSDIPKPTNALWRRREGLRNKLAFSVGLDNASVDTITNLESADDNRAAFQDFEWVAPAGSYLDVCTGLMQINFTHCNAVPDVEEALSLASDDHDFIITLGIEGWTEW